MHYQAVVPGRFLSRPNRFVAHVEIDGTEEVCHVKNTGRCKELLVPGCQVWCAAGTNPGRKTKYDLIAVEKGDQLINMDSQAPNAAVETWLKAGGIEGVSQIRRETVCGDSRFDFSFIKDGKTCFLEVKGVTLENDGICAFPDAPTVRGTKHLTGLKDLAKAGVGAYVLFVIQMEHVQHLIPNELTDPSFARTLREAAAAGVHVMAVDCRVTPSTMTVNAPVPVIL